MFSTSGTLVSSCLPTPRDSTTETNAIAPNSQRRRSRRQATTPPITTTSTPKPKYWNDRTGPWFPPTYEWARRRRGRVYEVGQGWTKYLSEVGLFRRTSYLP